MHEKDLGAEKLQLDFHGRGYPLVQVEGMPVAAVYLATLHHSTQDTDVNRPATEDQVWFNFGTVIPSEGEPRTTSISTEHDLQSRLEDAHPDSEVSIAPAKIWADRSIVWHKDHPFYWPENKAEAIRGVPVLQKSVLISALGITDYFCTPQRRRLSSTESALWLAGRQH